MVKVVSSAFRSGMTQGGVEKPGCFVEASLLNPIFLGETSLMRVSPLDDKNDCSWRGRE
ncbi:MAG: hypothetical protein ICV61_03720 [Microcoleus sp. Co-bin12]|nr:hypothetical protein [Microcoleus sp. Co-bin12]